MASSGTLVATPPLLRKFGAPLVAAAPFLGTMSLSVRTRTRRGWWASSALTGISIGFPGIFACVFSPPVLERIGHELGWPGSSLRICQR